MESPALTGETGVIALVIAATTRAGRATCRWTAHRKASENPASQLSDKEICALVSAGVFEGVEDELELIEFVLDATLEKWPSSPACPAQARSNLTTCGRAESLRRRMARRVR